MQHALVVGGTGMLSNVSLWLIKNKYHVSIIGRSKGKMKKLMEETNLKSHVTAILVDYTNSYDEIRTSEESTIGL